MRPATKSRPNTLQEFNQQFPGRPLGRAHRAPRGKGTVEVEIAVPRERLMRHAGSLQDIQAVFSQLDDEELGDDAQLLLAIAGDLPILLKHEPGLMDQCAGRCLQAASQATLATQEQVWLILRNALPRLPQATALALRDRLRDQAHHMPASVV